MSSAIDRERLLAACVRLEQRFRELAASEHAPGLAFGVIHGGELVHWHTCGTRDASADAAGDARVDADSVFRIASMSKSFTAMAILRLRDADAFHLDEPVARYVPELTELIYPTADCVPVRIRDLLTMSAGWPQDDPWADRQLYRDDASLGAIYAAGITFSNPPATTFEYSNLGYMLLGRIITNVTGRPAVDYITHELLQPLGLRATAWDGAEIPPEKLARGYRWQDEAWEEEPLLPGGGDVAAFAGLYSSVRDLARWVAYFLDAWPPRDDADTGPLSRASRREMQTAARAFPASIEASRLSIAPTLRAGGYGYGLSLHHTGQEWSIGHGGGLPGFGSHMRWRPRHDLGIVVLSNITYANVHTPAEQALAMLIEETNARAPTLPITSYLATAQTGVERLIHRWDDALADALFADNFLLDLDRTHWQRRFDQLREQHGKILASRKLEAENWLRGAWRVDAEHGWYTVWTSLSPTVPPRVQALVITSTFPPTGTHKDALERIVGLLARPRRRALEALLSASADRAGSWKELRLAAVHLGPCKSSELIDGDGQNRTRQRLVGRDGELDMAMEWDADGAIADLRFSPAEDALRRMPRRWP